MLGKPCISLHQTVLNNDSCFPSYLVDRRLQFMESQGVEFGLSEQHTHREGNEQMDSENKRLLPYSS